MQISLAFLLTLAMSCAGLFAQVVPRPTKQNSLVELSGEIRSLSRRVAPAVVQISVSGYGPIDQSTGHPVSLYGRQESIGSGVIVDPEGYIVTSAHVVSGAVSIRVAFASGPLRSDPVEDWSELQSSDAKIVGVDTETDLAVLKIEKKGLTALKFMNSDRLRQGDLVLALGAPMGLPNSMSLGVVSAPARELGEEHPMVYVQTDASINPGNSGGALVNMNGLLAGINTFILSQSGGNEGLGFAIPANTVRDVYLQVRQNGVVKRGELGVFVQSITPIIAKGLSLARDHGVVLADVDPEGPADRAGLRRGDVLIRFNGQAILSARQLENRVFRRQAGDSVQLDVLRGKDELTMTVVVRERADATSLLARLAHPEKNLISRLGVLCIQIDKDVVSMIPGLRREYGLIVAAKSPGGQAQFLDLQPGDIIDAVNTLPVAVIDTLRSSLDDMKPGDPVVLQIERNGRFQYLAFELDR
ncbi:MAG: trypsin-like peptidase domain-containing protein [Bryobacteraceae bacterium]|jgi:serine protease Do